MRSFWSVYASYEVRVIRVVAQDAFSLVLLTPSGETRG